MCQSLNKDTVITFAPLLIRIQTWNTKGRHHQFSCLVVHFIGEPHVHSMFCACYLDFLKEVWGVNEQQNRNFAFTLHLSVRTQSGKQSPPLFFQ